jgi:aspartate kinase
MIVQKFGGTSVGSVENIKKVKAIVNNGEKKIIVLSAMSQTTNKLLEISDRLLNRDIETAKGLIEELYEHYQKVTQELIVKQDNLDNINLYIENVFRKLRFFLSIVHTPQVAKEMVSKGELLSTHVFHEYLLSEGISNELLIATDFMRKNEQGEPDNDFIQQNLELFLKDKSADLFITQGFICQNHLGEIDNLDRGGSDYSASLIGAGINADNIQIWTDIDGFHNNDPRVIEKTDRIAELSFDEAAELAYFGAKILHPLTILPAKAKNIKVLLKNTMKPKAEGTVISDKLPTNGIKAIAAKDNITAIKIKSARMLLAHGFLKSVFEIFSENKTAIDMITTSEIAVSLTIDDDSNINKIVASLNEFSEVVIDKGQTIICVVGHNIVKDNNAFKIFNVLQDCPVRMVSYGGSNNNISLLVPQDYKKIALEKLHNELFTNQS